MLKRELAERFEVLKDEEIALQPATRRPLASRAAKGASAQTGLMWRPTIDDIGVSSVAGTHREAWGPIGMSHPETQRTVVGHPPSAFLPC